jgi:hypothetical protein
MHFIETTSRKPTNLQKTGFIAERGRDVRVPARVVQRMDTSSFKVARRLLLVSHTSAADGIWEAS